VNAPVFEKGEAVIEAPQQVEWDTLSDFRSWPSWMPGVRSVEIGETLGVGTRQVESLARARSSLRSSNGTVDPTGLVNRGMANTADDVGRHR
jgi:hypothetical protein